VRKVEGENAQCRKRKVGKAFFLAGDTKEKADNRQQIWEICLKNKANWREHLKQKQAIKKSCSRKMETVATNEVEAAVSSVDAAEGKGMESVPEKKVSRKSQHKQEGKELCTGRI